MTALFKDITLLRNSMSIAELTEPATASVLAKALGLRSAVHMAKIAYMPVKTVRSWAIHYPKRFDCLLTGAKYIYDNRHYKFINDNTYKDSNLYILNQSNPELIKCILYDNPSINTVAKQLGFKGIGNLASSAQVSPKALNDWYNRSMQKAAVLCIGAAILYEKDCKYPTNDETISELGRLL